MNQPDKSMVAALLAELAARAEVTRLKNEQGQHGERQLFDEVCALHVLAQKISRILQTNLP